MNANRVVYIYVIVIVVLKWSPYLNLLMKTYFSLCFIILVSSLSSCTKDKNKTDQEVLLPLKVGNQWQYELKHYNEDGSIGNSESNTILITKDTVINGETYFYDGSTYYRNSDVNTVISGTNAIDFYVTFKRTTVDKTILVMWKKIVDNCKSIDNLIAYTQITNVNEHESLKNEVVLTNCFGVQRKWVIYLAPGIGITQQLLYLPNSTNGSLYLRAKSDLKSYKHN